MFQTRKNATDRRRHAFYASGGKSPVRVGVSSVDRAEPTVVVLDTEDHIPTGTAIDTTITFDEFYGQDRAKKLVLLNVNAWEKNPDEVPGHMLFTGPGGTGKTTIAHAVANKMGTKFITTTPHNLRKPDQIFDFFFFKDYTPKIEQGDIVFIDEVHGFDMRMAGFMYNVLQDFCLDYLLKDELNYGGKDYYTGDVVRLKIPQFLCIGATTDAGMMHAPLRSRFINRIEFDLYNEDEICQIVREYKKCSLEAGMQIAKRSSGNPRKARSLAKLSHLVCSERNNNVIESSDVFAACDLFGIDEKGLDKNCQRVVEYFVKTGNKPAGTSPVSASTGIYRTTLEGETFPSMSYAGVLVYTSRGKHLDPKYFEKVSGN